MATKQHWFIELLLPSGAIEARLVSSERTREQLSADIHAAVADLLAHSPSVSVQLPASPLLQQQQLPTLTRRLLLAYVDTPAKALRVASDLREKFGSASLPWSHETRQAFDAYLQSVLDA
jgi:hypothetical protein